MRLPRSRALSALLTGLALAVGGCAGHADRTKTARSALDAGRPKAALKFYNEELGLDSAEVLPSEVEDEEILLILDRSIVLQWLNSYALSSRDLEFADKQVEVLDFSRDALDDIGKYMFSDDAGPYQAPAYEKLMINTMNMMNYLARRDLNGARVEARRLAVMQKFIDEHEGHGKSLSGPGSYLAGFVFEKSNQPGEALRYYDEALQYGTYESLREPLKRLAALDPYRSPRIRHMIGEPEPSETGTPAPEPTATPPPPTEDDSGEVLVIVNYGRVPAKIAKRVPIGLALTFAALYLTPRTNATANRLAAQGLVTWVNYPTLGQPRGEYGVPEFSLDGRALGLEGILAVDREVVKAWKQTEGAVMASAITRMITRVVAGETTRQAAGGGAIGTLLSLGSQAALTAADTPDTRSWATLPARIAYGRTRVAPGRHDIRLSARGHQKAVRIDVPARGWAVVVLTVLR